MSRTCFPDGVYIIVSCLVALDFFFLSYFTSDFPRRFLSFDYCQINLISFTALPYVTMHRDSSNDLHNAKTKTQISCAVTA